jgi:hypothetical protein
MKSQNIFKISEKKFTKNAGANMQKVKKTFSNRSMSGSKEILIGTLRFILTVIEMICNKADF